MKISKVNHKHAAVVLNENSTKGILYKVPDGAEKNQELKEYIQNLNKSAKSLYNVLIYPQNKTNYGKEELYVLAQFNKLMKGVLKSFREDGKTNVKYQIDVLKMSFGILEKNNNKVVDVSNFQVKNGIDYEEIVDKLIINTLRNSLRKTVIKQVDGTLVEVNLSEILKLIMLAMCSGTQSKEKFRMIREADLRSLLKYLKEDYTKTKQSEKMAKSIENQNVKAQVMEKEGKFYVQLSKKEEGLISFLQEYVHGDKKERDDKLMHMRKLFVLFFYGPEEYEAIRETRIPIRSIYKPQNAVSLSFSPAADVKIQEEYQILEESKSEKKTRIDEIKREIRKSIMEHYRASVRVEGITESDRFWLEYIERFVEKELKFKTQLPIYKLENAYLMERGWKEFQSYIAMKYVDIGKAVYHFVLPKSLSGETTIREVKERFQSGLTSFDYERIKAEDEIERKLMTYIAFATHTFSNAVLSSESNIEDVLICQEDELKAAVKADAQKDLLAYFGGYSKWKDESWVIQSNSSDGKYPELVKDIREQLKNVRNGVFHYAGKIKTDNAKKDSSIIKLFDKELNELGKICRKKYYSNNVWMFYDCKYIDSLMDELYSGMDIQIAQIPAFDKVLKRSSLNSVWSAEEKNWVEIQKSQDGRAEKYWSAVYFLMKEIYYQGFLKQENLIERFEKALEETNKKITAKNEKKAMENFQNRVSEIKRTGRTITFGELCQQIMTDYNMQNPNVKAILSNEEEKKVEKSYEHFPILLHNGIRDAFLKYLESYKWLKKPTVCMPLTEEEFCERWTLNTNRFADLSEAIKNNQIFGGWYIIAHLLTPKYLNHLVGDIKNYIRYVTGIKNRELLVMKSKNRHTVLEVESLERYKTILRVLEFSREFCGRVSNCVEDYFEDYAKHISHYVDFGSVISNGALEAFCAQPIKESPSGYLGIYYDGKNAIPNRNVILAKLYGSEKMLEKALEQDRITEDEIRRFYRLNHSLKSVYIKGKCDNKEEREKLSKCQQAKNRIELRDIVTFTEIINDFMSQLISWCYLRERDLMYFQLGVHYLRLFFGSELQRKCIEPKYRKLKISEETKIEEGAILYQIMAMYTYALPVYYFDEKKQKIEPQTGAISAKIRGFLKYCGGKEEIYNTCLELFQYMSEEREVISLRNEIDHFKYYTHMNKSMMDMYSEIFDRFFVYDLKLKKSVSYIFKNILMNYAVIAKTCLQEHTVTSASNKAYERKTSLIRLSEDGLQSDVYTYKFEQDPSNKKYNFGKKGQNELKVNARSEKFLKQLRQILEYSSEGRT